MFYLPQVDHEEHTYGPESKQAEEAVHLVDDCIGKMTIELGALHLPINYVFVSDHGMTTVDTLKGLSLPPAIDSSKFIITEGDATLHLYAKNKSDIQVTYKALKKDTSGFKVYLTTQTPAYWHYSATDDRYRRIGDILLVPKWPKVFNIRGRRITPGKHGYDNAMPDMQATFYAWGPAFKQHIKIGSFDNVHVYPLVARILGLSVTEKIDGNISILQDILR